jgi:hypothetical protein
MDADNIDPLGVGKWFRKKINPDLVEVDETVDIMPIDVDMETDGDVRYCPACIEVNDHMREGRRRILFLIPWASCAKDSKDDDKNNTSLAGLEPRLRSFSEFLKKVSTIIPLPKMFKNKKMSLYERQRRVIVETYRELASSSKPMDTSLVSFLSKVNTEDIKFLSDVPVAHAGKTVFSKGTEKWEGSCCLAMDRRHFVEGFLIVTASEVTLMRARESNRRLLRLPMSSILLVGEMRPEATPFQGYKYFYLETFARVYYFMVRSERQLSGWILAFKAILPIEAIATGIDDDMDVSRRGKKISSDIALYGQMNNTYYAKTPSWKLGTKRIMNFRSIIFTSEGLPERLREVSPCELVEMILHKAFQISQDTESVSKWISFMNDVSALQTIDIYDLTETEKAAMYLNLFHTMVLHGMLIFGPPTSWASWPSFFNTVSYIFAFDIVSIAELEHNILR